MLKTYMYTMTEAMILLMKQISVCLKWNRNIVCELIYIYFSVMCALFFSDEWQCVGVCELPLFYSVWWWWRGVEYWRGNLYMMMKWPTSPSPVCLLWRAFSANFPRGNDWEVRLEVMCWEKRQCIDHACGGMWAVAWAWLFSPCV